MKAVYGKMMMGADKRRGIHAKFGCAHRENPDGDAISTVTPSVPNHQPRWEMDRQQSVG